MAATNYLAPDKDPPLGEAQCTCCGGWVESRNQGIQIRESFFCSIGCGLSYYGPLVYEN